MQEKRKNSFHLQCGTKIAFKGIKMFNLHLHRNSGFTMVELLFVILLIGVMLGILMLNWHSLTALSSLNNTAMKLSSSLQYCKTQAILTGNQWFLRLDKADHTFTIVNDDGWLGTTMELDLWGNQWPPRNFFIGSRDFSENSRNNGAIDVMELDLGPFNLGPAQQFLNKAMAVTQITFNPEGDCYNDEGFDEPVIWITLPEYLSVYSSCTDDGTDDERKFRKGIKVYSLTGDVEIISR